MTDVVTAAHFEVEKFKEITGDAPAMFEQNEASKTSAITYANGLFENISATGMNDAMDDLLKKFIAKGKTTIDTMNERRKPFTQLVDAVKKRFTTQENELKSAIGIAEQHRNEYATAKMKEREEVGRQARLKLEKENEAIRLQQEIDVYFAQQTAEVINTGKHQA